jgi:succinate-semialdehyde dehydrogenase/glutarate-semialdehyde dehydrogenase
VEDAKSKGADILTGGHSVESDGYFFELTILGGVKNEMKVIREVLGPAAHVTVVGGEEEAISEANNSEFGLGAWTDNLERGTRNGQVRPEASFWWNQSFRHRKGVV